MKQTFVAISATGTPGYENTDLSNLYDEINSNGDDPDEYVFYRATPIEIELFVIEKTTVTEKKCQ
jgi:hypothetical protein